MHHKETSMFSSSPRPCYDVFLNFRGKDTRNNFTSHLYTALKRNRIETYMDEKTLERGDDLSRALPEAIKKSKISIIIFSENYASSSWCLCELLHILECRQHNNHVVIPIFYKVDPSDIKYQNGSYRKAFAKHEERLKDKMDDVQKWKEALKTSANLSGWVWNSQDTRSEAELIMEIVKDVSSKLDRMRRSNKASDHNMSFISSLLVLLQLLLQVFLMIIPSCVLKLAKFFLAFKSQVQSKLVFDNLNSQVEKSVDAKLIHNPVAHVEESEPSLEEVKEAFGVFDENNDGFIDAEELQRVLSLLGSKEGTKLENCKRMIGNYDINRDGRIDFNEFVKFMESTFC